MVEVTEVSLTPPPASAFAIPSDCAAAASPASMEAPRSPGEVDEIAALTGGNGQHYLNGIYGPGSKNSCTMIFRIVHAGTMEPIISGFQVGADLAVETESAPSYNIQMSKDGHTIFSGGGLHEITSQTQNGVFRVGAQTVLLYVVKDPGDISKGGDWLWVKAGKYAMAPH
jgi:hypothetical protein